MDKKFFHEFIERGLVKNNRDNTAKARHEEMPLPEKPYNPQAPIIKLTDPDILENPDVGFLELVECRSSIRSYTNEPFTINELSYLLWCTQGVKQMLSERVTQRNVPSAGSRHAFETYLFIDKVEGLKPGLYRFLAMGHVLQPVDISDDVKERMHSCFNKVKMFDDAAITFIWAANMPRMEYTFGGRALQYLYIDAGHVCQNLYLAAYTIKAGVCAVGHFHDYEINEALGLDGENDFVVYAAHVGKV